MGEVRVHNASLVTHFKLTPLCYNPYTKHTPVCTIMYIIMYNSYTDKHKHTCTHISTL